MVQKYQKNKPFVFKNNIELKADNVSKDEKATIKSKLYTQIDDSAKTNVKDKFFVFHYYVMPPVFDTNAIVASASNMTFALINLGFYHPEISYSYDIVAAKKEQKRVTINYNVIVGKRTTIDTVAYVFDKPELEELALKTKKESFLKAGMPITKSGISQETNRLVNLFKNNGYYKFTADEIRVTGDTSIEALTSVSDDPFEQLRLLAEANRKRNTPTIKLAFLLDNLPDTTILTKYYVNDIYVLPDYKIGDSYKDSSLNKVVFKNFTIKYHRKLFTNSLLQENLSLKKGVVFSQDDYFKTINDYYKLGVWESPNIDILEQKDTNLLNMVVKLVPQKKYALDGNIEMSYSANNTTSSITTGTYGNLLGLSANLALTDRNLAKSAVRMTNGLTAGIEFNTANTNNNGNLINSNELTWSNSLLFPKFIFPFTAFNHKNLISNQSVINTNISLVNRIDFYDQQIFNTALGYTWTTNRKHLWTLTLLNFDYRRIYNRSNAFNETLAEYPFLKYSFNTALVMGSGLNYTVAKANPKNPNIVHNLKLNFLESGLPWNFLKEKGKNAENGNFFNKYLRTFIKTDISYTYTINHPKSAIAFRTFTGVGIPLTKSDTTLPFFEQYFGGGPNSMRGWPVRGIGVGGQKLLPFQSTGVRFNDRTGDIQMEENIEYRFDVAPLFANAVLFKMAVFTDIGNIWNFKNTQASGGADSAQFKFENLYKQLGVSSGVGFRFDFHYFLLRLDMSFRFKRPDLTGNDGWQLPNINFSNIFGSSYDNRLWRYENFGATFGIGYAF
ncbi:MAG TPA: BamA/TamA family outer membrane protein [Hanamia sp.]